MRLFGVDTNIPWSKFPHKKITLTPQPTKWVLTEDMTTQEKEKNPTHTITGGYLKVVDYKEACVEAWNSLSNKNKDIFLSLDFNIDVATQVTGIDFLGYITDRELFRRK